MQRCFSLLALAGAVGLLGTAIPTPAQLIAQTYNGNDIYKITRSNGSPAVIVANQTPGDRISVTYPNATQSRRVTANGCGLLVLRSTSTRSLDNLVSVDGSQIDQATLPQQLLPRCVDGNLEEARTSDFRTGAGEVVLVKTPNTVYQAVYAGGRTRRVTVNACGFAQVTSTSTYDMTTTEYSDFEISSTDYSLGTLPEAAPAPLCRSGNLYTPAGW